MKRLVCLIGILLLVAITAIAAGATALYVQDVDPWDSDANQNTMTSLGISYVQTDYASVAWGALGGYQFVLMTGSNLNGTAYNDNAIPHLAQITDYVTAGGLVIIHYAPSPTESFSGVIAPGGVAFNWNETNNVDIALGYSGSMTNGVNDSNLDNWYWSAHGYLSDLPGGTTNVLINGDTGETVYAQYHLGLGQVWVTSMAWEWEYPDAGSQGLSNELTMAKNYGPVPIPGAVWLLGSGLLGLTSWRRFRKS